MTTDERHALTLERVRRALALLAEWEADLTDKVDGPAHDRERDELVERLHALLFDSSSPVVRRQKVIVRGVVHARRGKGDAAWVRAFVERHAPSALAAVPDALLDRAIARQPTATGSIQAVLEAAGVPLLGIAPAKMIAKYSLGTATPVGRSAAARAASGRTS